jgi:hypothetical protein
MIAPAKTPGNKELEIERNCEIDHLKSQLESITETLKESPVDLIRKHPLMATGGAAAVGFLVAQFLPGKSSHHHVKPEPKHFKAPPPPPPPSFNEHLLTLAAALAEKYFAQSAQTSHASNDGPEEIVGTVTIADTGSASGAMFPGDFTEPAPLGAKHAAR